MVDYILIPRRSVEETLGLVGVEPTKARGLIWDEANYFARDACRILEGYGLQEQRPEKVHLEGHLYTRLPHVGAVAASFESKEHAEAAARDISDYWLVRDIELSLPVPRTAIAQNVEIDLARVEWPEGSGVEHAHSQGLRGQGVLVGVLDTGCDADHVEHLGLVRVFRYVPLSLQGFRDVRGFDPHGHGTHVCGILAGQHVGVAPEVNLWVASIIESETMRTSLRRVLVGLD